MASAPSISVIIATSGRTSHLELTLASYARQSYRDFEVIVAHPGGSHTEGLVARFAARAQARALNVGGQGRGHARNLGIRAADGDTIILADDARIVPADYLATLAAGAPDEVRVGARRAIIPQWIYHLPGATTQRLLGFMRNRSGIGANLYPGVAPFFGLAELEAYFDEVIAAYQIDDYVWERMKPIVTHFGEQPARFHLPWLLALAGNLCVPRRALFEVGLCDDKFYGWDLEDPDLGYKLHRHGLHFRVLPSLPSWHQQRSFLTYPFCLLEGLQRFHAAHDPVDAWLLLRFLTDEDVRDLDALAASRPPTNQPSIVDRQLQRTTRELVPHLIHGLGRWWAQDTGR